jgi:hypothetical protein
MHSKFPSWLNTRSRLAYSKANAGPTLIWSHDMKSCVRTCNDHARTGVLVMQSGNYKQMKELMNLTCLAWLYGVQGKGMIPQSLLLSWKSRRKLRTSQSTTSHSRLQWGFSWFQGVQAVCWDWTTVISFIASQLISAVKLKSYSVVTPEKALLSGQ